MEMWEVLYIGELYIAMKNIDGVLDFQSWVCPWGLKFVCDRRPLEAAEAGAGAIGIDLWLALAIVDAQQLIQA